MMENDWYELALELMEQLYGVWGDGCVCLCGDWRRSIHTNSIFTSANCPLATSRWEWAKWVRTFRFVLIDFVSSIFIHFELDNVSSTHTHSQIIIMRTIYEFQSKVIEFVISSFLNVPISFCLSLSFSLHFYCNLFFCRVLSNDSHVREMLMCIFIQLDFFHFPFTFW